MEENYLMWLSRIDGMGYKRICMLLEHFGSAEAVWYAAEAKLRG